MGMFDELKSDYSLPGAGEMQSAVFQTKDLECITIDYFITADGRLLERVGKYTPAPQLAAMKGLETPPNARTPDAVYRPLDFTGEIYFYTFRGTPQEHGFEWFEYAAEFIAGRLQHVERIHTRGSTT